MGNTGLAFFPTSLRDTDGMRVDYRHDVQAMVDALPDGARAVVLLPPVVCKQWEIFHADLPPGDCLESASTYAVARRKVRFIAYDPEPNQLLYAPPLTLTRIRSYPAVVRRAITHVLVPYPQHIKNMVGVTGDALLRFCDQGGQAFVSFRGLPGHIKDLRENTWLAWAAAVRGDFCMAQGRTRVAHQPIDSRAWISDYSRTRDQGKGSDLIAHWQRGDSWLLSQTFPVENWQHKLIESLSPYRVDYTPHLQERTPHECTD